MHYKLPPSYYQSPAYAKYVKHCGFEVKSFEGTYAYIKRISTFLAFAKIPKATPDIETLKAILDWSHNNNVTAITLEPSSGFIIEESTPSSSNLLPSLQDFNHPQYEEILRNLGFHKQGKYNYESRTRLIKIQPTRKAQLHSFPRSRYRTQIRNAYKNNLSIEVSTDIEEFIDFFTKYITRRGILRHFSTSNLQLFWNEFSKDQKARSYLIFVRNPHRHLLAAILLVMYGVTAYYRLAASSIEGEKLQATKVAVLEAMQFAQSQGCSLFDFAGVIDPNRSDQASWKGLSHFKKGFGGIEFQYTQPWTWYTNSLKGSLLKLVKF